MSTGLWRLVFRAQGKRKFLYFFECTVLCFAYFSYAVSSAMRVSVLCIFFLILHHSVHVEVFLEYHFSSCIPNGHTFLSVSFVCCWQVHLPTSDYMFLGSWSLFLFTHNDMASTYIITCLIMIRFIKRPL